MESEITFEYQVVRYAHDPSSGESLNVGVVVYAREPFFLECRVDSRYGRLSDAFAGFDGEGYRSVLRRLKAAVDKIKDDHSSERLDLWRAPESIDRITASFWPDRGLSYRFSPVRAGVTANLEAVLENLFARFVTEQSLQDPPDRRSDDDVWSVYQRHLVERNIGRALQPVTIKTDDVEIKFDHSYRNGRLYAIQPVSMDLARSEGIQTKATNWLGKAVAISGNRELAKIYMLLGKPSNPELIGAYEKAKSLLSKGITIRHELVEESAAAEFADRLRREMIEQGVIQDDDCATVSSS